MSPVQELRAGDSSRRGPEEQHPPPEPEPSALLMDSRRRTDANLVDPVKTSFPTRPTHAASTSAPWGLFSPSRV
ncbi:hypothetical protein GN956_G11589 [Arapaima gigas]